MVAAEPLVCADAARRRPSSLRAGARRAARRDAGERKEFEVGRITVWKPGERLALAPRIPELVVRSDNHQDFHDLLLLLGFHQRPKLLTPDRWGAITRYRDASIGMSSRNTWPEVRQNRSENGFAWLVVSNHCGPPASRIIRRY